MLNMLVNSFPKELTALSGAYEANDWFAIQNLAHKLKGGVSYCGTLCLREACSNLELAIKERKNELCEDLYNQLLNEIERAEKTIKEKLFEY